MAMRTYHVYSHGNCGEVRCDLKEGIGQNERQQMGKINHDIEGVPTLPSALNGFCIFRAGIAVISVLFGVAIQFLFTETTFLWWLTETVK